MGVIIFILYEGKKKSGALKSLVDLKLAIRLAAEIQEQASGY